MFTHIRRITQAASLLTLATAGACTLPDSGTQAWNGDCADGVVTSMANGATYDSLEDAFAWASADDAFCLGGGDYEVNEAVLQRSAGMFEQLSLSVVGQGSDFTRLVGSNSGSMVYMDTDGSFDLEGVTVVDARLRLSADDLSVSDVLFTGYNGWERGLTLKGDNVDVSDLRIEDNQLDYASGLYVSAGKQGRLDGFTMSGNRSVAGYMAEFHGPIEIKNGDISDNVYTQVTPGYDLIEFYGPTVADSVRFERNDFNGPMVRAYDAFDGNHLDFGDNRTLYAAVLSVASTATLNDSHIAQNDGAEGAVGIYDGGSMVFDSVDFGSGNAPCDVSINGVCAADDLSGNVSSTCDDTGCR